MTNAWETSESRWNLPKLPFPSIAVDDTHARTPILKPRRGPQTLLQARHLCQASWQISEARTYWKYALAHMWQQHNVHEAFTWFRAEHKSTGDPSIHDWLWQNQEIPLMISTIYTLFKYLFSFLSKTLWMEWFSAELINKLLRELLKKKSWFLGSDCSLDYCVNM